MLPKTAFPRYRGDVAGTRSALGIRAETFGQRTLAGQALASTGAYAAVPNYCEPVRTNGAQ
jgi:hypothetical protein